MTEETRVQDLVYALATSPNFAQDGICFAARPSGLYRSDDGGHTWHFTYGSLNLAQPLPATAVVVSPDFASDQSVFAGAPGGILHSVDGGQTWYVVMLTSPPPLVSALVVSPNFTPRRHAVGRDDGRRRFSLVGPGQSLVPVEFRIA